MALDFRHELVLGLVNGARRDHSTSNDRVHGFDRVRIETSQGVHRFRGPSNCVSQSARARSQRWRAVVAEIKIHFSSVVDFAQVFEGKVEGAEVFLAD